MGKKESKQCALWPVVVGVASVVVIIGVFVAAMSMAYSAHELKEKRGGGLVASEANIEGNGKGNASMQERDKGEGSEENADVYDEPAYPNIDSTNVYFFDTTRVVRPMPDCENQTVKKILEQSRLCRYYNDRFGFTFLFPSCFKACPLPMNNDGCRFQMGHSITVKAVGHYDVSEISFAEHYTIAKRSYSKLIYSRKRGKAFVVSGFVSQYDAHIDTGDAYEFEDKILCWEKTVLTLSYEGLGMFVHIRLYYPLKYKNDVARLIKCLDRYNAFIGLRCKL